MDSKYGLVTTLLVLLLITAAPALTGEPHSVHLPFVGNGGDISLTGTVTNTPSPSSTAAITPTVKPTGTYQPTATHTDAPTISLSPTATATLTGTRLPTATRTYAPAASLTPSATLTGTPMPTPTATRTSTRTPTATATSTATPSPTATASPTPTPPPPACFRVDPPARSVTAPIGMLTEFVMRATDPEGDLTWVKWYTDGVLRSSLSASGTETQKIYGTLATSGSILVEAVAIDSHGLSCMVDWVLTGMTPTPTATATSAPPASRLRITALVYKGTDEYVQITNRGTAPQNVKGWKIQSVVGDQWYTCPYDYELNPGASVRIHSGPDARPSYPTDIVWTTGYVWDNTHDEARLISNKGVVVDSWSY